MRARDRPAIDGEAMGHGLPSKTSNAGASKPWSMAQGERVPGDSGVVMRHPANESMLQDNSLQTGEAYPIVKTKKSDNEDRLLYGRTAIDRCRCLIRQRLMLAPLIIADKERP